jgi:hypothetical protein
MASRRKRPLTNGLDNLNAEVNMDEALLITEDPLEESEQNVEAEPYEKVDAPALPEEVKVDISEETQPLVKRRVKVVVPPRPPRYSHRRNIPKFS